MTIKDLADIAIEFVQEAYSQQKDDERGMQLLAKFIDTAESLGYSFNLSDKDRQELTAYLNQ